MKHIKQPTKEQVRDWLAKRRNNFSPIPDIEQIRQELGWKIDSPAKQHYEKSGPANETRATIRPLN